MLSSDLSSHFVCTLDHECATIFSFHKYLTLVSNWCVFDLAKTFGAVQVGLETAYFAWGWLMRDRFDDFDFVWWSQVGQKRKLQIIIFRFLSSVV